MKKRVRYLFYGFSAVAVCFNIVGLMLGDIRLLTAAGLLFAGAFMIAAVVDRCTLRPIEKFADRILDSEDEVAEEENLFDGWDDDPFLKRLDLALYRYEKRKRDPEGAEMFRKQTELMALQSQINPHFLYNTLDTIRGQAVMDHNSKVADMIETLGSFFRYSISGKKNMVMLRDEITHTRNYIQIQQFRFENRFTFELDIDEEDEECLNCYVPRLILQPIVENAIFHGLENTYKGGQVSLGVALLTTELLITVSDNGKGMSAAELDSLNDRIYSADRMAMGQNDKSKGHTGIALPNINKRIKLLFGDAYGLTVYSSPGSGTEVEIMLPLINRAEDEGDETDAFKSD